MKYWFIILLVISNHCIAGVAGLTIHSRANCGNNESISWDMRWYRVYATSSSHFNDGNVPNKFTHVINTGWEDTWRSAAVDWVEASPGSGWRVIGTHWMKDPKTGCDIYLGATDVTDCSVYDGWWDQEFIKGLFV